MQLATTVNRTRAHGRVKVFLAEDAEFMPLALRTAKPLESPAGLVGREGHCMSMNDVVLKYPTWQEPYRAAVIETNPKLRKHKIAGAQQAAILRLKQLEDSADRHHELTALTDALTALKILGETNWAE